MYTNDTYRRITYKWERPCEKPADYDILLEYADRLQNLENLIVDGRIKFLPCRLGQTIYFVNKYRRKRQIELYVVDAFVIGKGRTKVLVHQFEKPQADGILFADQFGKEVFTSMGSAIEALEVSKKNDKTRTN